MTIGYSKRHLSLFVVVMNVVNFEWVLTEKIETNDTFLD